MNYRYARSKYAIPEMSHPWYFYLDPKIVKGFKESPDTLKKWFELPMEQDYEDLVIFRDEQAKEDFKVLQEAEDADRASEIARKVADMVPTPVDLSVLTDIEKPSGVHDLSFYAGPRRWMEFDVRDCEEKIETSYFPRFVYRNTKRDSNTFFVPAVPLRVVYPKYPYSKYTGYVMSHYMSEEEIRCVLTTRDL